MKQLFTLITIIAFSFSMQAQEFGYGFKTGLNFNSIKSDDLRPGEEFDTNTGFHIGAIFGLKFTDLMGVRGELLYSIRGGRLRYDGEGVLPLVADNGQNFILTGNRRSSIRLTNSYLEIPITFYYKPASWLELSVGAQAGILLTSSAVGQLTIDGETTVSSQFFDIPEFEFDVNYNFKKDNFDDPTLPGQVIEIAGEPVTLPESVNAYTEFSEDYGNVYNVFDFGLVGGASFYLNEGLFIGARAVLGLADVTNNEADRVNILPEGANSVEAQAQDNVDTNFAVQVSVGFTF